MSARIDIDLVAGTAWVTGAGTAAIDALLGNDPNTVNGWAVSEYDTQRLTADGYLYNSTDRVLALVGDALQAMSAGGTMRVQSKQIASDLADDARISFVSANGDDALEFYMGNIDRLVRAQSWRGSFDALSADGEPCVNTGEGAINTIALTMVSDRVDIAANGFSAASGEPDASARPPGNPLVAWVISHPGRAVQRITIYDPLPDTAGLSELSETA